MSPTAAGGEPGKKGNVQNLFFEAIIGNYFLLVLCVQCFFVNSATACPKLLVEAEIKAKFYNRMRIHLPICIFLIFFPVVALINHKLPTSLQSNIPLAPFTEHGSQLQCAKHREVFKVNH